MAVNKWQEYVEKLGRAENQLRTAINEWRRFKNFVTKQRYENTIPKKFEPYADLKPRDLLTAIDEAKIKVKFCEIKIEYYRELEKKGATVANREKRRGLEAKAAMIVKNHLNVVNNL